MSGKFIVGALAVLALITAVSVYYLQVYHFYDTVSPEGFTIETAAGPMALVAENIEAIDADSSPIRFRACFDTDATLPDGAVPYEDAIPLTAPFWFGCFDAEAVGAALEAGEATAWLAQKNIAYGVDRVVAVTNDGRGYVWHQLNNCGETDNFGNPVGDACPERQD
ncbi:DUF6446 family protein [Palleronia caenipelagi]|uniref:Histidine kinase n=1 Tax=Palleronia caenipelagi TaxID=2489174 RepID=A0A547Q2J2_9RHOB|nr:DUF6446 family protein [Palleronia caenipelagi]TRD20610.1 histidine kinase [Palleronia caenipelagi]